MGNNLVDNVWAGNTGQLFTRSTSAGVSHSITTASVNTQHSGRKAASIKHRTTGEFKLSIPRGKLWSQRIKINK